MAEPSIYFSEVNERQGLFHRRAILLGGFAGVGMAALASRLAYLQLVETGRYEKLSASNQFNFKLIPAPRGLIVDRDQLVVVPVVRVVGPFRRVFGISDGRHAHVLANQVPRLLVIQAVLPLDHSPERFGDVMDVPTV